MNDINKIEWNQVKLTIVMPSYNRGEFLEQAIESVMNQKTNFSILLVITDDASTDGSHVIISKFEKIYPQTILALYSEKNQGLLANDIKVFEYMKSDYFCVLDPDDYWVDNLFLQKAVDFLEANSDYVTYGSNTKILKNGLLQNQKMYIDTNEPEKIFNGIEDFLQGKTYVTHTTASVYRNVMFQNGVPEIMKKAVGTLSEASYRGDFDRYVMHLKYGKAKFVNEWVGVYRIHEKGIWQGTSELNHLLLEARAELDYSEFYDKLYQNEFKEKAKAIFQSACALIYQAAIEDKFYRMSECDKQNFAVLMNIFAKDSITNQFSCSTFSREEKNVRKFMRNMEKRQLIIWGTGNNAGYLLEKYEVPDKDIAFFIDNNKEREGILFRGKSVFAPDALNKIRNKYIVIVSSYYIEILVQIKREELCEQEDIVNLFWYDKYISGLG